MPVVSVGRDVLFARLGETYTDEGFDELCFAFGIELDDVTSERQMYFRDHGGEANVEEAAEALSDAVIYKVDIPANRYDLLSLEGLVRALRVFLSKDPLPNYGYLNGGEPVEKITVTDRCAKVRPFVVGAVIRGIKFDEDSYNSFLDFQDKLHFTLCRRRTLVAIGTHDLDTVKGPFKYDCVPPKDVRFRPLFQDREYTGTELDELYAKDSKFSAYMGIISKQDPEKDLFPLITDANGVVLSMPPVINGEHSKLSLATRNVLVECTATDLTKAHQVLNTIVCNFSQYAAEAYQVERVSIVAADGSSHVTPDLATRDVKVCAEAVRKGIGHPVPTAEMSSLLTRMQLPTAVDEASDTLTVTVPALRTDVLHPCDVVEDVAIAFGYNNVTPRMPATVTAGSQQPVSEVTDLLRMQVAMAGFTEALTLILCHRAELFEWMRIPDDGSAIVIENPKGIDYETARNSLIPSLLKTVAANKSAALPLRLFEVSDVVIADKSSDVGARNERRLCAVHVDMHGGFEAIHGLLDRIMESLGVNTKDPELSTSGFRYKKGDTYYEIEEVSHPSFLEGRCARVLHMDKEIGRFGIAHPLVCEAFGITTPTAVLEMIITPFI